MEGGYKMKPFIIFAAMKQLNHCSKLVFGIRPTARTRYKNDSVLVFLLMMALMVWQGGCQELSVLPLSREINVVTNYTFQINSWSYAVTNGATLAITFPAEYSTVVLRSKAPYSGYAPGIPYIDQCFPACLNPTFSYAGNTFFINGIFPNDVTSGMGFFMSMTIFNIPNPSVLGVGNFVLTVYKGSSIYYPLFSGQFSINPTFIASTMAYTTSLLTGSLWATSPITFTFTPSTLIDTIQFDFPDQWTNESVVTTAVYNTPTCTSVSNPTLSCAMLGPYLQATNLQYYTAGTPIDITVNQIYSPTSLADIGNVSVSGLFSDSTVTTAQVVIPGSSFTRDTFRSITTTTTYLSGDKITIDIAFSFAHSSMASDIFQLVFSSDLAMSVSASDYSILGSNTIDTPNITFLPANRSLTFLPFDLDHISTASLTLTLSNIPRPRQCKTTAAFTLSTYRQGATSADYFLMDYSSCCSVQLANRQTLTVPTPTLSSNSRLKTSVIYIFSLTTVLVSLVTGDGLIVEFPAEYSSQITSALNSTICAGTAIQAVNNATNIQGATCSVQTNSIKLSNFLKAATNGVQTFLVTVTGITNPSATPASGFNFATISSNGYILEEAKGITITINSTVLTAFTASANVYQTNLPNAVYSFAVGNNAPLVNGYTLQIGFPSDYTFLNYSSMVCTVAGSTMPCGRLNSTYGTNTHTVLISVNSTKNNLTTVTISSVTNPVSRAITGAFTAKIVDTTGTTVESNGVSPTTVTMTSVGDFSKVVATTYNYSSASTTRQSIAATINSVTTSLFLYLVTPFTQTSPSSLTITLTNTSFAQYSGSSGCVSAQFVPNCGFSNSSGNIVITLPTINFTTSSNYIQLEITNLLVNNYQALTLTAALSVNSSPALATATPVTVSNMYVEQVSAYSITQTSHILAATTDVTISLGLSAKATSQTSSVTVYIPLEFGLGAYASHAVIIANASLSAGTATLTSLTNPSTSTYTPFLFLVTDISGNTIAVSTPTDSSKTYTFTLNCNNSCRTCNGSLCQSCYTTISWITAVYLDSAAGTCVTGCSVGQYLSGSSCLACNSNCKTCTTYGAGLTNGSATNCLTCNASQYLLGSVCFSVCPTSYYPSFPLCVACMTNCLTCSSGTSCLTCITPYSYLAGKCLTTCPAAYLSIFNSTLNESVCLTCPANCLLCSSTTVCTHCSASYLLDGSSCVSVGTGCSGGKLPDQHNVCSVCQCLSCSFYSFNCTACNSPKSLYNYQCLSACPTGYYSSSRVCTACMAHCAACTSASYCSICFLPYILTIASATVSSCVATCAAGSIATIDSANFSYICEQCTNNCGSCLIDTDYCTACNSPRILSNNSCVLTCPPAQFVYNNTCRICYPDCRSCDSANPTTCYVCNPGYYFQNNLCATTCPNGTYPEVTSLSCAPCNAQCNTCENSNNCTSCPSGFFLANNNCYSDCQSLNSSYFSYNGVCLFCQPQCTGCTVSPYACTSCSDAQYYFNPATLACTLSCASPYYASNTQQCLLCAAPCATCDTVYDSCLTCLNGFIAYGGGCVTSCPSQYYNSGGACAACGTYCLSCNAGGCTRCQGFAYLYYGQCVLDCLVHPDLPLAINNYCTSCAQLPYCQSCTVSLSMGYSCFLCVPPYVIFNGNCLNECPQFYAIDSSNLCQPTPAYAAYQTQLYEDNKPKLPPFFFLALLVLGSLAAWVWTNRVYTYTYHCGYLLAFTAVADIAAICYWIYYVCSFYTGDYAGNNSRLPLLIIAATLGFKFLCSVGFVVGVVGRYYLKDVRYQEWREQNRRCFGVSVFLILIFGPRLHKLLYSKWLGKACFSYRIVSVQKFYWEDVVNWWVSLVDAVEIAALAVVAYNIFITYAVLYLLPFELITIKILGWIFFLYDLRKPDRGFFQGDEEQAEFEIKMEQEALERNKRKFQIENLAKLIKCKSADHLHHDKLYEFLFFDDFRSVYDPKDYEDPPIVPHKKIFKNIERGRFRKGKKISIEQKLRRFAESIKPTPEVTKDDPYLHKLIYWRPPKKLRVKPEPPKESQESMLNLLRDKELYYDEDFKKMEIYELDEQDGVHRDPRLPVRNRKKTFGETDQQTLGNRTFYEPSSLQLLQGEDETDYNTLMNRNYARKRHLPDKQFVNQYDEHELRILHHLPKKKRQRYSRMNELSIRRG